MAVLSPLGRHPSLKLTECLEGVQVPPLKGAVALPMTCLDTIHVSDTIPFVIKCDELSNLLDCLMFLGASLS